MNGSTAGLHASCFAARVAREQHGVTFHLGTTPIFIDDGTLRYLALDDTEASTSGESIIKPAGSAFDRE